jgi:hypothetical protein
MAEVAAGPHASTDPAERARRQDRLQRDEATFEALPFDVAVPLCTRNPDDFRGLENLVTIIAV